MLIITGMRVGQRDSPLQGVFKDMFASPKTPAAGAAPSSGRQSEVEGTAWEKAAEWSRNILDISRPFATTGEEDGAPGNASTREQPARNLESRFDEGLRSSEEPATSMNEARLITRHWNACSGGILSMSDMFCQQKQSSITFRGALSGLKRLAGGSRECIILWITCSWREASQGLCCH